MIISFDLDDTLIAGADKFPTEKQNIFQRILQNMLGLEKLRLGTTALFKDLRNKNHQIYIYTTSFRSLLKVKLTFLVYGLYLDFIVNQQVHNEQVGQQNKKCSKYPPTFGIDIHIDDSLGVRMEGEKYNFKTIIIAGNDTDWIKIVLANL